MKILASVFLLIAAVMFISAVARVGLKLSSLSGNAFLRLTDTFLLAAVAVALLACTNKNK